MEKVVEAEVTIQDDKEISLYELILRARAGDEEAKEDVLRHPEMDRKCSAIAARKLNANEWATDYISPADFKQELLLKVSANVTRLNLDHGEKSFWDWVNTVATNVIFSLGRKWRREIISIDRAALENLQLGRAEQLTLSAILRDAFSILPKRQQQVLEKSLEGYTLEEIARDLCISKSTASRELEDAYKTLRETLELRIEPRESE